MNTVILLCVLLAGQATISTKTVLIWGVISFFLFFFVFYWSVLRPRIKHDKKLDEEKIQTEVEIRVGNELCEIDSLIQELILRTKQPVDFSQLAEIKDTAENLSKRLVRLTNTDYCSLTDEQHNTQQDLCLKLGGVENFLYSKEAKIKGAPSFRV